jgi:hypothetical protein
MEIEVWFGTGEGCIVGPIEAKALEELPNGEVRFSITDPGWLDWVGWDEPVEFTYPRLRPDGRVGYDAYVWCPKGEGPKASWRVQTKWW